MFVKACIAGALALVLSPSDQALTGHTFTHHPYVEKISCAEGSGTGFKIADGRWITVAHVAKLTACSIDGLPISVTHIDDHGDFAVIAVPGDHRRGGIAVNCGGYRNGVYYWALGHARGDPFPEIVPIRHSDYLTELGGGLHGWAVFYGQMAVIPGMSGGPVLDQTGRVVGTVNAYNPFWPISFSRPLSETVICKGAA